ncbi:MAG TPA: hypothetical protein VIV11_12070 [Kofleriaceae bacterium]
MRFVAPIACVALAGCGDIVSALGGGDDSGGPPDAPVGVRVTGCDDPNTWTEPALTRVSLWAQRKGGHCNGVQYPLSQVPIGGKYHGVYDVDHKRLGQSCWRVVDATPGSGLMTGQEFTLTRTVNHISLAGFSRPVTLEGRILYDDGTIVMEVEPGTVALDPAIIVEPDASNVIAVMTRDTWAERNAVHMWGQRIATDEVVAATASPGLPSNPITVHRTASGFVRSTWSNYPTLHRDDLALGPGTRARIADFGRAIVIDNELVLIRDNVATPFVRMRVPLATEPLEIVGHIGDYGSTVTLHFEGSIAQYAIDASGILLTQSLTVGSGALVAATNEAGYFFDGTRFHRLASYPHLGFHTWRSFTPRAEDLAMLGAPIEIVDDVVFGENGLMLTLDTSSTQPGARFASTADLFGPGTRVGPVAQIAAYVIRRDDGTAAIYAPEYEDCYL